ncbi:hypothetical protein ACIGT4_11285 [Streptomyces sioyaensis]|uniref:hypothetical protein n=1 Tax=Streptomyces sioyaensis TaxID=67364 RepID=UPI0037D55DFA
MSECPGGPWRPSRTWPWASTAPAERLAQEELAQARAFGAPRALGISLRAAGLVARGQRSRRLLEESVDLGGEHLTNGFRKLGIAGPRHLPEAVRSLDARS